MEKKEYSIDIGDKPLVAEFTDLAKQANGSVLLRYGNTAVLATAVMSAHEKEGLDYFPLTVDYEEKFYAAGEILGSRFMRREGRPSEEAVLSGRATDRTIRPLFEKHIRNEVQVVVTILSIDEDDPDVLAINAASLALATSDIPWNGPVSAIRIGRQNGSEELTINPPYAMRTAENESLDLLACGKDGLINMIEIGAKELPEGDIEKALSRANEEIEKLQEFQKKIVKDIGREKVVIAKPETPAAIVEAFSKEVEPKLASLFASDKQVKPDELKHDFLKHVGDVLEESVTIADDYFEEQADALVHREAVENDRRIDGRKMDEVRSLFAKAGDFSPILHGSGIFYRGDTHIFSTLTLGGPDDSLIIDSMEEQEGKKHFMHHYNFPPFSTGETGRIGGTNRRMIGHGALAEKALSAVIPPKETFPYTIRLVSEVLSSNGSSSMGSTCASTIALMDGGVPIKAPVAGIAMGLMMHDAQNYKVLTDIQGPEDHHGDMDFKVAGTRSGVTAVQMDVKVGGIPLSILSEAFADAKKARLHILDVIEKEIKEPRPELSPNAPYIEQLTIKPDQIGLVIGPGGKTINEIKDQSGVKEITIEDDGAVYITGEKQAVQHARKEIEELTREYKAGDRFEGEVTRILDFGAFVKIGRGTEGLVHISEIAPFRVEKVTDHLSIGQKVPVVIKEIDEKERINLSIKKADPDFVQEKK